jgi:hypothetical protein
MRRLIETGWACGGALALKAASLARNRVISSVGRIIAKDLFPIAVHQ